MTEEENTTEEVTEESAPQEEASAPEESNSLFDALFTAADERPVEEEEVEEPQEVPVSLTEAMETLPEEPEQQEVVEEEVEPEGEAEVEVEAKVEKAKPKKKKVKQVIDPDIEEPESATPEYNFPEEDPDKDFLDTLLPEERDIYETAKFASENLDGYTGKDKEFKDYFTKTKQYIEKRLTDDPHTDLSQDEDYQAFISKNRPEFSQVDIKRVERERSIAEAMRRIEEKQAPERERARIEQDRAKKQPEVHKRKVEFREYSRNSIPEELADQVKDEEAIKNFSESNPLEFQIVDTLTRELHNMGDTLLDITQNMVSYDENNQQHTRLLKWVNDEQENFIKTGQTQHEGKTFMRRERYYRLPEAKRTPYYTWSDGDLLAILTMRAKQRINESLQMQRDLLAKSGYSRQQVQAQQAQAPKPQPVKRQAPPAVSSAPRPGNTPATTPKTTQKSALESVLGL